MITIRHKDTLTYKYGCCDARFNNLGSMHLLFWNAIQEAKSAGLRMLDFGRTNADQQGLITFKNRWGAAQSVLTYSRYGAEKKSTHIFDLYSSKWKSRAAKYTLKHVSPALLPDDRPDLVQTYWIEQAVFSTLHRPIYERISRSNREMKDARSLVAPPADEAQATVQRFVALALAAWCRCLTQQKQLFCYSLKKTERGMVQEGLSPRYTMMTLMGLHRLEEAGGVSSHRNRAGAREPCCENLDWVKDIGDLGVLLWTVCSGGARTPGRNRRPH